jgi:hypothetical protein
MDTNTIRHFSKKIQGSQGIVGECMFEDELCVFKHSNTVDHCMSLEYDIMKSLEELPHFCRVKGIENNWIFMEKYPQTTLSDLIYKKNVKCSSVVTQAVIAISAAQQTKQFTHYDLHTDNILVVPTEFDYHKYILQSGNSYTIKTEGISPVIIDFGYSYIDNISPYRTNMEYMSRGYTTYEYDPLADMRLLITTLVYDMNKYYTTNPMFDKLSHLFYSLPINYKSGWYHTATFTGALTTIRKLSPFVRSATSIFNKSNFNGSIELFNQMIDLPLTTPDHYVTDTDYKDHYRIFLKRWLSVEKKLDTKRAKRTALIEYLKENEHDETITVITNKLKEIMINTQIINRSIRNILYNNLSVSSAEDILTLLVDPDQPPLPPSAKVKVFNLSNQKN